MIDRQYVTPLINCSSLPRLTLGAVTGWGEANSVAHKILDTTDVANWTDK